MASRNDNLCSFTGVSPKTPTYSYPQYDEQVICPPNHLLPPLELPRHLRTFNKRFEQRRKKLYCCEPHVPPAYRPVFPVPPAEFWTPVHLCNPWSFFDRSSCCDKPRPYNWENDSCPTQYCRPGGKAVPPYVIPYPNLGLYFPPCDVFRVKC
ncbi:uncharacterized protein LOC106011258 [Aplysia californica]|uniref:Uncharacterized protein LOC106011258 n=1 Tax=Aplysia californica TaxID=6500 RepID=A0ABM0ZW26_APLCA|nr:uncharacterized protein LOC106011258 [Aplysia californica]